MRAGMIQTPYVEFEESVYRYRFQGPVFADREGYLASSDFGIAIRTQFPKGYGEIAGGLYNGEGFARFETNNQKAMQVRGTVRPFPNADAARGLRLTVFYDADHYTGNAERRRAIGLASFEHRFVNLGAEYLAPRIAAAARPRGSIQWLLALDHSARAARRRPVAPPAGVVRASLEGLLRFDRRRPDRANDSVKERWIAGLAYWPSMRVASVSAGFLLDYERVRYRRFAPPQPDEKRLAVHMLLSF